MIFKLFLIDVEMILNPCGARFARRLSNPIGIHLRSDFVSIWVPFEVPFGIHLGYIWGSKSPPFGSQFGVPNLSIWRSIWDPKPSPYRVSNGGPKRDPKSEHLCSGIAVFGNLS